VWCCLCDLLFSRFSRTPTCDGRTDGRRDGRTQGHGWYRGCIASRGKNDAALYRSLKRVINLAREKWIDAQSTRDKPQDRGRSTKWSVPVAGGCEADWLVVSEPITLTLSGSRRRKLAGVNVTDGTESVSAATAAHYGTYTTISL